MQLESAIQVMQTDRLDFEKRTAEVQSTAISEAVSKTRNELDARHREEKERLEKQVVQKNEEIRVKEDELQRAVKKEHKKYTELFKAFQEIAEESNQMSKSAKSEHDLRAVARKLKHLVKDQKLKIAELMSKNEASMSAFEECKNERDALHSDVLKVSEKLQERNTSIAHLELEESKVKSVFAAKEAKLVQERDDLLRTREISVDEVKRHYKVNSCYSGSQCIQLNMHFNSSADEQVKGDGTGTRLLIRNNKASETPSHRARNRARRQNPRIEMHLARNGPFLQRYVPEKQQQVSRHNK
ncbi:hypothetical protein HDU80_010140 [Chytriomyces hyalinus]|nr:hypothetical protein HDU80_010140 [Chytriomyces hyalinus]